MSIFPKNLILVRSATNLPGFKFGQTRLVNGDDPYIVELLDARPPLLVRVIGDDGDTGES